MEKILKTMTAIMFAMTIIFIMGYDYMSYQILLTLAITTGTCFYHFMMRLAVGYIFSCTMNNHVDYTKKCFRIYSWENRLYKKLKVKQWKNKMPTYRPEYFDIKKHTLEEIIQSMLQAELVHEVIVVLSFVPVVAGHWFGDYPVFIITSLLAALFDLLFVIMQRYNRQRVLKLIIRKKRSL